MEVLRRSEKEIILSLLSSASDTLTMSDLEKQSKIDYPEITGENVKDIPRHSLKELFEQSRTDLVIDVRRIRPEIAKKVGEKPYTNKQLGEFLAQLNLKKTGKKEDLIERLEDKLEEIGYSES